ncbi:MAG: hypothetical protein ACYC7D_01050 [Nitrososphaerales archaeon]
MEDIDASEQREATGDRFERAKRVVEGLGVKQHLFTPSGVTIWTVVGKDGDFLVDIGPNPTNHYCSCNDFHYRVLSNKVPECYHLIAARRAISEGQFALTEFDDEELGNFLKALLKDLLSHVD